MPRRRLRIQSGGWHHFCQHAVQTTRLFDADDDRALYARLADQSLRAFGVGCAAFALMDTHSHMLLRPPDEDRLRRAVSRMQACFARHTNRRRGTRGPLWVPSFYADFIPARSVPAVVKYIERNPVEARLVTYAESFHWSSAAWRVGEGVRPRLVTAVLPHPWMSGERWRTRLRGGLTREETEGLLEALRASRGDEIIEL